MLSEEQELALAILVNYHRDPIDAIGVPVLGDDGKIEVEFQSGDKLMVAIIEETELSYKIINLDEDS